MAPRPHTSDMRVALILGLVLVLGSGLMPGASAAKPAPLQRSISSSKQFVIYFSDPTVRARLAQKTEDIKEKWRRFLHLKDDWKAPIIIQVVTRRPRNAPRMLTSLYESDGGEYKVQIDVYDPAAMNESEFDREVLRALCLEYSYRTHPTKAGRSIVLPPAWLVEGMAEDMLVREEGIPAGLYEMLIRSGPPPRLANFLKIRPERLDATSRAIYRAQAMALLRALLDFPQGADELAGYLTRLPSGNASSASELLDSFPGFSGEASELSKVWTLSLAGASAADRMKPLSMGETSRQLALLLEITAPVDPKNPSKGFVTGPEALQALGLSDSAQFMLSQKAEDFLRLELRAHPILRPIIEEYRGIATVLARRPRKNVEKRIRMNHELQNAVEDRIEAIEDYVNWFEATQIEMPSQEFDDVIDAPHVPGVPARTDRLSRHLDAWESRGW